DKVYPAWGKDFVAVVTGGNDSGLPIRAVSSSLGDFAMALPANRPYHIVIFDPQTGLVAHGYGTTPPSRRGPDLTASLVFAASVAPDSDSDGLPDDIENAIGTSVNRRDTDGDGIDDFAEIEQGLEPRSGQPVRLGTVATVPLQGEAREVVLEGS